jgi:hypothetical protein
VCVKRLFGVGTGQALGRQARIGFGHEVLGMTSMGTHPHDPKILLDNSPFEDKVLY